MTPQPPVPGPQVLEASALEALRAWCELTCERPVIVLAKDAGALSELEAAMSVMAGVLERRGLRLADLVTTE